ncbi:MAG TPA: cytochrome c biogenesis protein CcsA [Sedimentisphaerales bacterium]|nr:cytochrome c biogenesis protein CcsA [Sedimentisphaerales bacterium]
MNYTGEILLAAVFVLSSFAASFGLTALMLPQKAVLLLIKQIKIAMSVAVLFCLGAFLLFESGFLLDDFSLAAVAQYSSSTLNIFYKLSAAWAGASGSLLLWTTLVFVFNSLALLWFKAENHRMVALCLSVASIVGCCFSGLLLFVARPFAAVMVTTDEGFGLNPMLQNFWNVIHPPLLFIGYAGLGVAFVFVMAFVFSGENDIAKYKARIRAWLLFGLFFLSLGIATGAIWSYIELGWGGYWAWDPVENASLLPWFAAVAALHCFVAMGRNKSFKFTATILTPLGFALSILATFITRSGVLQSVHAFGKNPMLAVLTILLAVVLAAWLICVFKALKIFISDKQSENDKRGDPILWGIWLMIASTLIIAVATFWPILSKAVTTGASGAVLTRSFYDRVVGVVGILLVMIIAAKETLLLLKTKGKFFSFVCFGIGTLAGLWCYYFLDKGSIAIALGSCVYCFTIICFKKYITKFKGRLGSDISHLGFLLLVLSVGFTAIERAGQFPLQKGSEQTIDGYKINFSELKHEEANGIIKSGPVIVVTRGQNKKSLWPCENVYPSGQVTSEVAVWSGIIEDVYVIYENMTAQDEVVITIKFIPMISWLWTAAVLMIMGMVWSLFEKWRPM